jgi:hypothetical protein
VPAPPEDNNCAGDPDDDPNDDLPSSGNPPGDGNVDVDFIRRLGAANSFGTAGWALSHSFLRTQGSVAPGQVTNKGTVGDAVISDAADDGRAEETQDGNLATRTASNADPGDGPANRLVTSEGSDTGPPEQQREENLAPQVAGDQGQWECLNRIVRKYEAEIRKRWLKGKTYDTETKRTQFLLKVWPHIPKHRESSLAHRFTPRNVTEFRDKDYICPMINLEDLGKSREALMLLLNSRCLNQPQVFAATDLQSAMCGIFTGRLKVEQFYDDYRYSIAVDSVKEFGKLYSWKSDELGIRSWLLSLQQHVDPQQARGILEVQTWLFIFLMLVVRGLLPDKDLEPPALSDAPTPDAAEPSSASANDTVKTRTPLPVRVFEEPYRVPATMDLDYLISLVNSKRCEAGNHIMALRNDPGYFRATREQHEQHERQNLHVHNKDLPSTENLNFRRKVVKELVVQGLSTRDTWTNLRQKLLGLRAMQQKYSDVKDADGPLRTDYFKAYSSLYEHLRTHLEGHYDWILDHLRALTHFHNVPEENLKAPQDANARKDAMQILRPKAAMQALSDAFDRAYTAEPSLFSDCAARKLSSLTVFSECLRQLDLRQSWASLVARNVLWGAAGDKKAFEARWQSEHQLAVKMEEYTMSIPTSQLAWPKEDPFAYPVDKPRTPENINKMREAVVALDLFWKTLLAELPPKLYILLQESNSNTWAWISQAAEHPSPPWAQALEWEQQTPKGNTPETPMQLSWTVSKVMKRIFYVPSEKDSPPAEAIS